MYHTFWQLMPKQLYLWVVALKSHVILVMRKALVCLKMMAGIEHFLFDMLEVIATPSCRVVFYFFLHDIGTT